ncbi:ATP-binding protein, partial [Candidatus Woesearchaeota archaeon]|nr:ATP-binding protein [Candidatus Woesearchaeota archaeon]
SDKRYISTGKVRGTKPNAFERYDADGLAQKTNKRSDDTMTLYIPVGISGSGKSTITKRFSEAVVVSPDLIRLELYKEYTQEHNGYVFYVAHSRVDALLEQNKDVVFDATNISLSSVRVLMDIAKRHNCKVKGIILDIPIETCKERIKQRVEAGGQDVPEDVLERQYDVLKANLPHIKEEFGDDALCISY